MTDVDRTLPPSATMTVSERVRSALFPNVRSGIVSILLLPILVYSLYRLGLFLFVNGQWEAVSRNLTLFMQGTFARDEQWRLATQLVLLGLTFGIGSGTARAAAGDRAREAGLVVPVTSPLDMLRRFWSIVVFVAVLLYFAATVTPWLLVAGFVVAFVVGLGAKFLPSSLRTTGWLLAGLTLAVGFQVVSGTTGRAWLITGAIVSLVALSLLPTGRFAPGLILNLVRLGVVAVSLVVVFLIYTAVVDPGVSWDRWSGLHLTLWVSALAIILSFPFGLLLALARRSSLPAVSALATAYIELIRGVPLITLLFMGQFILGFMLAAGSNLSSLSRAITAITLFSAAYMAEIVRGGLQALPIGQTEAGQALGLRPTTTMRRIVLPQALRAVIPAMVGQFISLFKDTSLLFILAITEFLGVRSLIHSQADFRSIAHAETLVFIAFGYWAFAYSMSKESQRLERRLGAGDR